ILRIDRGQTDVAEQFAAAHQVSQTAFVLEWLAGDRWVIDQLVAQHVTEKFVLRQVLGDELAVLQLRGQGAVWHLDAEELQMLFPVRAGNGVGTHERAPVGLLKTDHHELTVLEAQARITGALETEKRVVPVMNAENTLVIHVAHDMRFTLRQLQVFVAVAQQESVSRAAVLLSLSQSAASTSITELERQSSCQLFDRAGKRLSLNATGRQLLPQAVALLDQAKEIEDLLNGKSGFGSLAVGATLTIGNYLATLLIGSFMQRHPESQVKLHVQNTANIVQQVAHYEIDLGLIEGDCSHPDIEVQTWVEDELVVFCAPQHPLAKKGRASLEELTREAWILREQGSGTRLTFDQAMRHHLNSLNVRLELEHTEAIKRAVESGLGIGCISRLALRDAFRRGSLVAVETPELDLRRDCPAEHRLRRSSTIKAIVSPAESGPRPPQSWSAPRTGQRCPYPLRSWTTDADPERCGRWRLQWPSSAVRQSAPTGTRRSRSRARHG
nr:hypothetical protein [Tanacetum cinerariifolium]